MTGPTMNATPGWRDVALEQVRFVGVALRPAFIVLLVVLAAGTVIVGGEILMGGPGFDSTETFPTAIIAFLFPFAVWRGESRFGPSLFWTFPVDRRRLALTRTFAGGVWLLFALVIFISWLTILSLIADVPLMRTLGRVPLVPTIAAYLFGSAVILGFRHPVRWLSGAAALLLLLGLGSDVLTRPDDGEWQYVPGASAWFSAARSLRAMLQTLPETAQWAISTSFWLLAGVAALLAAISRHRESRRR